MRVKVGGLFFGLLDGGRSGFLFDFNHFLLWLFFGLLLRDQYSFLGSLVLGLLLADYLFILNLGRIVDD